MNTNRNNEIVKTRLNVNKLDKNRGIPMGYMETIKYMLMQQKLQERRKKIIFKRIGYVNTIEEHLSKIFGNNNFIKTEVNTKLKNTPKRLSAVSRMNKKNSIELVDMMRKLLHKPFITTQDMIDVNNRIQNYKRKVSLKLNQINNVYKRVNRTRYAFV